MRIRRLTTLFAAAGAALALGFAGAVPATAYGATPLACVQPNDRVSSIVLSNGIAYLGGRFTSVRDGNGTVQPRAHLAAVDTATCSLTTWRADTNGEVEALTVSGGVVYVGGAFTTVGGTPRAHLTGVTTSGAAVTALDGHLDGSVLALAVRSGLLYAGGSFLFSAGAQRNRLAAYTLATGALVGGWAPRASATVRTLATDATRVYVGGDFTRIDALSSASHLAALDPTSGAVLSSFAPHPGYPVYGVVVDGSGVYVAGGGGGGRLATFRLDGTAGATPTLTDGDVQTVTLAGTTIVAGGHFNDVCVGGRATGRPPSCISPLVRKRAFAVDRSSNAVTSWAPSFNSAGGVFASAYDAATGRVWLGGDFTTVNGAQRAHLAVL